VETRAEVIPLDFDRLEYRVNRRNRAILTLGAALRREGWMPMEAIEAAARETQREAIAAENLEALAASAGLLF
jgi:hypothetical protein